MTPEDADQLLAWVESLDARQLRLLWRWLTLYYMAKGLAHGGRPW